MKHFVISILLVLASITGATGQNNPLDLSGTWKFQIDRDDAGIKERWFDKELTTDHINLPGSMPEKLKGDDVTVRTRWTGSLYDSSYYFNPYMEKYRIDGQVKLPFFLTPDKHYVGVAWYQKTVQVPANWKGQRIVLFLERPHIETTTTRLRPDRCCNSRQRMPNKYPGRQPHQRDQRRSRLTQYHRPDTR